MRAADTATPVRLLTIGLCLLTAIGAIATAQAAGKNAVVKDQYIIVFKEQEFSAPYRVNTAGESVRHASERLISHARRNQVAVDARKGIYRAQADADTVNRLGFSYEHAIKGFSARLTPESVELLRQDPSIDYIEPDVVITADAIQTPTPAWGLDRIDQRNLPLNNAYQTSVDGTQVHAYVVDSGVSLTHVEFSGRIGNGYDFISNDTSADDCLGHGTHVAGTIGGTKAGVAKNVTIHPVRVVNCQGSGTGSALIAGIDWVSNNHQKPAVANFSLGGPASSAVDAAINNLLSMGVTVIAAAGNESGVDACLRSPARVANAITVAASDSTDKRSTFSNIGACVDIFAPGTTIWSALPRNAYMSAGCHDSDGDAFGACSGTSMAAPHVAGVAALYLDANNTATPTAVTNAIIAASTKGKVTDPGTNSPNRMLYSEVTESGATPQNYGWMVPVRNLLLFY